MLHLHLHIWDGDNIIEDLEGETFADLDEARRGAIQAARELIAERVDAGRSVDDHEIIVSDQKGLTMMSVSFDEAIRQD